MVVGELGSGRAGSAESPPPDSAAAVLAGLDEQQRTAAAAVTGPVCILAGAGTGKTRTITHRIAYGVHTGVYTPEQVLAVTFTARAAGELRGRLSALGVGGVQARTFHAAAMRQLRYFAPRVLGGPMPELVENKLRVVAGAATRNRLTTDRASLRDLASEIEWAKTTLATPEDYPARAKAAARETPFEPAAVAAVYASYEQAKSRDGSLDFEDLLLVTAYALEEHRDVAREVRGQYRHFVVDEYQDVNPLQQRLLDAWLGGRAELCVVGDPNQTIYSFTGADPDHLLGFADRYPDAEVVKLERDYRSTPEVVGLANRIIGMAPRRRGLPGLRLLGQRAGGPEPRFLEHPDEPTEAAAVAAACRALVDGGLPAAEIAVLFRMNAQSQVYESALADAGVPYVLKGGERFFERPEVREAVLLLRGAAAGRDDGALVPTVRDVLASVGWVEHRPPPGGAARDRWQSLSALVDLAVDLVAEQPTLDLAGFVTHLADRAAAQHAPTVQGVTLASMHAAKGLEWDAVFVVGLVDGVLPIAQSLNRPDAVEEERRLLYVAVTRAREQLTLSWSLSRQPGGRRSRPRSRFLTGIAPESTAAARKSPAARAAVVLDGAAGQLFEALRSWRTEAARAASVPAYVVLGDATLQAIAETRPRTLTELAALPGIGARKLDAYGADVLATVAADT